MDPLNVRFPEDANTPARGRPGPIGTEDMPAGAEPLSPGAPVTPVLEPVREL